MLSTQFISVYVIILSNVLNLLGVQIGDGDLTIFLNTAVTIIGALWIAVQRYLLGKKIKTGGDVNIFGVRK